MIIRILQVAKTFKPFWEYGGVARVSYEISKHLLERGHEVSVYTIDSFDWKSKVKANELIWVDGIRTYYFRNNIRYIPGNLEIISPYILLNTLKNNSDFDVIHFHDLRTSLTAFVAHYALKHNIPYILQTHGSVLPIFQKQRLKKIFDRFFGYRILRGASKVIAITKTEAEQYEKMGVEEGKIEIVPNGIDLSEYENLPERGEFRRKYSIKDDEKIILYLGRIHRIKGLDLLIEAFGDISKKYENIKLVIAGPDDGFLSTLKKQITDLKISDKILFTGPLYRNDKLKAYVDADVYVLPSSYEIFGITVLEACVCGTPVIVTDRCGIADLVNGKIGYAVEYGKDQLRDAILKVLSDEWLRERFGDEGKSLVTRSFGWDGIIRGIEEIYEERAL